MNTETISENEALSLPSAFWDIQAVALICSKWVSNLDLNLPICKMRELY